MPILGLLRVSSLINVPHILITLILIFLIESKI